MRYSSKIWIYCKKIFVDINLAEDIFQETFISFYKAITIENDITNIQGYLLKIARNNILNHKKSYKSNIIYEELVEDYHSFILDEKYESKEFAEIVDKTLDLLTDEYREAFVLQVFEGLSYQEIADLLDIPISTVRNRVVRSKIKLKELLVPLLKDYTDYDYKLIDKDN